MNGDKEVMEHFPSCLSRAESDAFIDRQLAFAADRGFGLWAVEVVGVTPFAGFTGLLAPSFESHFTPCVEVGWRLARAQWGHGYATEAARASLVYGFDTFGLSEIIAMLVPENRRSAAVCDRLGMTHDPSFDFDHPLIPEGTRSVGGYSARRHSLYRLTRRRFDEHR